jgi:hypothetical protein
MAPFPAARRQHFAAAFRLHARAEPVRLGAAAAPRLIGALWHSNPPFLLRNFAVVRFTRGADSLTRTVLTASSSYVTLAVRNSLQRH